MCPYAFDECGTYMCKLDGSICSEEEAKNGCYAAQAQGYNNKDDGNS